jgi:hypothetical protein
MVGLEASRGTKQRTPFAPAAQRVSPDAHQHKLDYFIQDLASYTAKCPLQTSERNTARHLRNFRPCRMRLSCSHLKSTCLCLQTQGRNTLVRQPVPSAPAGELLDRRRALPLRPVWPSFPARSILVARTSRVHCRMEAPQRTSPAKSLISKSRPRGRLPKWAKTWEKECKEERVPGRRRRIAHRTRPGCMAQFRWGVAHHSVFRGLQGTLSF